MVMKRSTMHTFPTYGLTNSLAVSTNAFLDPAWRFPAKRKFEYVELPT